MNISNHSLRALALLLVVLASGRLGLAHESSEHKKEAGPHGGRVIESVEPRVEFFVTEDRKAQLSFLDDAGEIIPPDGQEVSLIGGDRSNPSRLAFVRHGDMLVSEGALPEGDSFPVVLEIAPEAGAKVVRERFNYNASKCPECGYAEYACICGHEE
jgi:hypothetical protein